MKGDWQESKRGGKFNREFFLMTLVTRALASCWDGKILVVARAESTRYGLYRSLVFDALSHRVFPIFFITIALKMVFSPLYLKKKNRIF
ncbi:MAG: hypothetical protein CM1200mP9_03130 [Gammaproteobacteria bacterium]|nr:MAG: hypothetical protein CM1200mP9_03130 [Gammaproteobacteria bacterium]